MHTGYAACISALTVVCWLGRAVTIGAWTMVDQHTHVSVTC